MKKVKIIFLAVAEKEIGEGKTLCSAETHTRKLQ